MNRIIELEGVWVESKKRLPPPGTRVPVKPHGKDYVIYPIFTGDEYQKKDWIERNVLWMDETKKEEDISATSDSEIGEEIIKIIIEVERFHDKILKKLKSLVKYE